MATDREIGRVVAVDTAQVTIELNRDLKGMSRTTYEGPQEVGRINGYVIIPVGARRLVAMVTRVVLVEEAEMKADRTMVALPAARRLMKATLIGTIDGNKFRQGISTFPVLDSPVLLAESRDLDAIFGPVCECADEVDPDAPGFCIPIGESAVVHGRPIRIDPDRFFGKHAAVLGSTGSGKSCTIASLIQSILEQEAIKRTTIVILDTNGEYQSAFQNGEHAGEGNGSPKGSYLYIPSDPARTAERLVIPYWFLNAEDFVRLFRAKEGLQAPVLLRALSLARSAAAETSSGAVDVEVLRTACEQILAVTQNTSPTQQWALAGNIRKLCEDGLRYKDEYPQARERIRQYCGQDVLAQFTTALESVLSLAKDAEPKKDGGGDEGLGATRIRAIHDQLDPVIKALVRDPTAGASDEQPVSPDNPCYFGRDRFLDIDLRAAMREQAESGNSGRVREACGPMFVRVRRFFEDPRFDFLFGLYPQAENVLAAFLRDLLGIGAEGNGGLSDNTAVPEGRLPFYDRQRNGAGRVNVVILDLSLLASEVLENVTALIGRLILEFLQRLGEHEPRRRRGSLPVVLVLEEAQNYIQQPRVAEDESIARVVFERIAREGRKYGLSLVIASQRPSELSKTVLSQCNSFIVHRLQNPEDLRYFKEIVPGIYGPMLEQLPALAPQTALVLGECVAAPALVRIRDARPVPRSRDPKFWKYWTAQTAPDLPVETVCAEWEGSRAAGDEEGQDQPGGSDGDLETEKGKST